MRPFLFKIAGTTIPSFFFMIMIAGLACTFYIYWLGKKQKLRREIFLDMGMIGIVAGVLGARIFHILVEAPDYYWEKPARVFEFWRGGFVSWGAFLGIVGSLWAYLRIRKLPVWEYLDILAVGSPIIMFLVRSACLLTGCCYGQPTDVPWAITFTHPASTAYYYFPNVPLHPVQVYSMIHTGLLFVLMHFSFLKKKFSFPGQAVCVVLMGWGIPRAFIELWRADRDRGLFFNETLSTGQIMGLMTAVFAFVLYRKLRKKNTRQEILVGDKW